MHTAHMGHTQGVPKVSNGSSSNMIYSAVPFSRPGDIPPAPLFQQQPPPPPPPPAPSVRVSTTAFSAHDMHRVQSHQHHRFPFPAGPSSYPASQPPPPQQQQQQPPPPPPPPQFSPSASAPPAAYRGLPYNAAGRAGGLGQFARPRAGDGEDGHARTLREFGGSPARAALDVLDGARRADEEGGDGFAFSHALLGGGAFRDGGGGAAFDGGIPGVASMAGAHLSIGLGADFVADGLQRRFAQRARQRPGRRVNQLTDKEKKDRHNAHTRSSRLRIDHGLQQLKAALLKANPNLRLNKKADIVDAAVKYVLDAYPGLQLQESSLSS